MTGIAAKQHQTLRIGDVFTPTEWGLFAIERFGIFERWLAGATVFDPTMGNGQLLEALVVYGLKLGYALEALPLTRLYGNELNAAHHQQALQAFAQRYGCNMADNFIQGDILDLPPRPFDIVFANPPWLNFADLPESYKEKAKRAFFQHDLVGATQKLLLGGSRIDMAALVVQRAMSDFLAPLGNAYCFLPLSLLLNDGASEHFRKYEVKGTGFALRQIFDFNNLPAFPGVGTRYGLVHFQRDRKCQYPIPYFRHAHGKWEEMQAQPLFHSQAPLSVVSRRQSSPLLRFQRIEIAKSSMPRQGINTCGANSIFFFNQCQVVNDVTCMVNEGMLLPSRYVFPLITAKNFKTADLPPQKWVLLPYNKNGKPLTMPQLQQEPLLLAYLEKHRYALENRKGAMLNATIKRGYWWALLGVGAYNFARYKIVWEAYGKKEFKPQLFKGNWQANQSLQAFMPMRNKREALVLLKTMSAPAIQAYLKSLQMEGTMNWAQPGRIKNLLQIKEHTS